MLTHETLTIDSTTENKEKQLKPYLFDVKSNNSAYKKELGNLLFSLSQF